jgi:hypothetical protein
MPLNELKVKLEEVEPLLAAQPFVEFKSYERNGRTLHVALTDRLCRIARKNRVWKSKELLSALKNAHYGFDSDHQKSSGGRDGIFLVDREFRPANEMMRKLFDQYLDKPNSGAQEVAQALGTTVDRVYPVRLVSHHMRLLGVLHRAEQEEWLVLVDYDDTIARSDCSSADHQGYRVMGGHASG